MKPIELNKQDFLAKVVNYEANPTEWKYLGDKPAIIDFYASWCGPCKMVAPILEELASEYGDKIYIYKVNTENEQELAAAFGIRSIPTILFVPLNGQPQMVTGAMPKSSFKQAIDNILFGQRLYSFKALHIYPERYICIASVYRSSAARLLRCASAGH